MKCVETRRVLAPLASELPSVGPLVFLWTDDNSNYAGVHTEGLLHGWVTIFDHEEPMLTPAHRSVNSFLTHIMASAPGITSDRDVAFSLGSVPREIPVIVDDAQFVENDRRLVLAFREMCRLEANDDLRRLYVMCAIILTPVIDTPDLLSFLDEQDIWIPEAAIRVLELRQFKDDVERLARLARDGFPNGDSAAMRLLVRMDTVASRRTLAQLCNELSGQKRRVLDQWMHSRHRLQPPRW